MHPPPPLSYREFLSGLAPECKLASVGLAAYFKFDILGVWYKYVNFGAEKSPVSPNCCVKYTDAALENGTQSELQCVDC